MLCTAAAAGPVAALCCCTKINRGRFHDRNRPLTCRAPLRHRTVDPLPLGDTQRTLFVSTRLNRHPFLRRIAPKASAHEFDRLVHNVYKVLADPRHDQADESCWQSPAELCTCRSAGDIEGSDHDFNRVLVRLLTSGGMSSRGAMRPPIRLSEGLPPMLSSPAWPTWH
jgi:hypothetical protein